MLFLFENLVFQEITLVFRITLVWVLHSLPPPACRRICDAERKHECNRPYIMKAVI